MRRHGVDEFPALARSVLYHWRRVDEALAASGTSLVLSGGYTADDLEADIASAVEVAWAVHQRGRAKADAAFRRDELKKALAARLHRFRLAVGAAGVSPELAENLPCVPNFTATESKYLAPLDAAAVRWGAIDASAATPEFAPPLKLGPYGLADFQAQTAELREAYRACGGGKETRRMAVQGRDAFLAVLRRRLFQYRDVAIASLDPGHVLLMSLPRLTPRPGSTPEPVELQGTWDAEERKACLAWTPSDNPHLERYSVRACTGPRYVAALSFVVASVAQEETTLLTDAGLLLPGCRVWFRVDVVTDTGHVKGSNAVEVVRPADQPDPA